MPRAKRFHKTFGDIASQLICFAPRPCGGCAHGNARIAPPGAFPTCKSSFIASLGVFSARKSSFVVSPWCVSDLQKYFHRFHEAFSDCESSFVVSPAHFRPAKVLSLLTLVCFRLAKVLSSSPRRVWRHRVAQSFCKAKTLGTSFALCRIRAAILQTVFENHSA